MGDVDRDDARRDALWALLFLAGLMLPVLVALLAMSAPVAIRAVVVLGAVTLTDLPLVSAGVRGGGPRGIVQPWRWTHYLFYLAVRLGMLALVVLVPS